MENIKDTILKFLKLDGIIGNVSGYIETRVSLVKLEIREEVAQILTRGLMIMVLFLVGFLFVLFLSIGMAEYLNTFFEYSFAGYIILAGFFGLLLLVLILLRKNFFRFLEKQFIEMIRQKQD